ncbi:MAG: TrkA C-terminal domain-containing protein, partial [Acidimicrobiia bacterium]
IRELQVRQNFAVSILVIKQTAGDGGERLNASPGPDYTFQQGDIMLIIGPVDALSHLRRGVPRKRPQQPPGPTG